MVSTRCTCSYVRHTSNCDMLIAHGGTKVNWKIYPEIFVIFLQSNTFVRDNVHIYPAVISQSHMFCLHWNLFRYLFALFQLQHLKWRHFIIFMWHELCAELSHLESKLFCTVKNEKFVERWLVVRCVFVCSLSFGSETLTRHSMTHSNIFRNDSVKQLNLLSFFIRPSTNTIPLKKMPLFNVKRRTIYAFAFNGNDIIIINLRLLFM